MASKSVYVALGLCAWGVLAFGAVYPWAYWPLAIASAVLSAVLLFDKGVRSGLRRHPLTMPLFALGIAIGFQLVPMPRAVVDVISPSTMPLVEQHSLRYALERGSHSLSILPEGTIAALGLAVAFIMLLLVMTSVLELVGARTAVAGIAILGCIVALIAIIQKPLYTGKIYGFWEPVYRTNSFGPFVNPNHFAGWMVMCLSLTVGFACGALATAMRHRARTWRDYLTWASGPEANSLALLMTAALTMGLSLILSMARSGIVCFVVAMLLTATVTLRQQHGTRRVLAVTYLLGLIITVMLWVGPATVAQEFNGDDWTKLGGRPDAWRDALSVIQTFPFTGTGINTYGTAMIFYQRTDRSLHYTAAHNDYLQLAAEGGLLIGIPIAWAFGAFWLAVRRRFRETDQDTESYWIRVGAVTGLIAIALQEIVDFSLQVPGNAVLFALLCAIAIHRAPQLRSRRLSSRWVEA